MKLAPCAVQHRWLMSKVRELIVEYCLHWNFQVWDCTFLRRSETDLVDLKVLSYCPIHKGIVFLMINGSSSSVSRWWRYSRSRKEITAALNRSHSLITTYFLTLQRWVTPSTIYHAWLLLLWENIDNSCSGLEVPLDRNTAQFLLFYKYYHFCCWPLLACYYLLKHGLEFMRCCLRVSVRVEHEATIMRPNSREQKNLHYLAVWMPVGFQKAWSKQ